MSWITLQLIVMTGLIGATAFLSAAEVAYTGLSLIQISRVNRLRPGLLSLWEKHPERVLATLLLSNNMVSAAVGVISASVAFAFADKFRLSSHIFTVILSFLSGTGVLVFGEILPKTWARHHTMTAAIIVAPIIGVLSKILSPASAAAVALTDVLLLRFKRNRRATPFIHERDLKKILTHSMIPAGSRKILDNMIDFSRSQVKDVMIPRSEVFALSAHERMDKIIERVVRSGYSRVPIYSGSLDNIIGLLYTKDLLVAWRSGAVILEDLLRPIYRVYPEMPLPDLLRAFRSGRHHLALVTSDSAIRRVQGLVTIQDALVALVGNIKEEP